MIPQKGIQKFHTECEKVRTEGINTRERDYNAGIENAFIIQKQRQTKKTKLRLGNVTQGLPHVSWY